VPNTPTHNMRLQNWRMVDREAKRRELIEGTTNYSRTVIVDEAIEHYLGGKCANRTDATRNDPSKRTG
jgi:hypothetical protein